MKKQDILSYWGTTEETVRFGDQSVARGMVAGAREAGKAIRGDRNRVFPSGDFKGQVDQIAGQINTTNGPLSGGGIIPNRDGGFTGYFRDLLGGRHVVERFDARGNLVGMAEVSHNIGKRIARETELAALRAKSKSPSRELVATMFTVNRHGVALLLGALLLLGGGGFAAVAASSSIDQAKQLETPRLVSSSQSVLRKPMGERKIGDSIVCNTERSGRIDFSTCKMVK